MLCVLENSTKVAEARCERIRYRNYDKLPGKPMVPDFVPLYAVVIVLFSLIYFSLASISFLLVRLNIPEVSDDYFAAYSMFTSGWLVSPGLWQQLSLPQAAAWRSCLECRCSPLLQWLCATGCFSGSTRAKRLAIGRHYSDAAAASDPLGRHAGQFVIIATIASGLRSFFDAMVVAG